MKHDYKIIEFTLKHGETYTYFSEVDNEIDSMRFYADENCFIEYVVSGREPQVYALGKNQLLNVGFTEKEVELSRHEAIKFQVIKSHGDSFYNGEIVQVCLRVKEYIVKQEDCYKDFLGSVSSKLNKSRQQRYLSGSFGSAVFTIDMDYMREDDEYFKVMVDQITQFSGSKVALDILSELNRKSGYVILKINEGIYLGVYMDATYKIFGDEEE